MSTLSEWQSDPSSASFLTSAYIQQALSNVTHATLEKKLVDDVYQAKETADQQLKSLIRENLGTFIDSQDAMRAIIGADRQLFSGEALQAIVAVFEDGREQCEELVQPIMSAHQQLHLTRQVRELLVKFQTVTAVPSVLYKACGVRVPAPLSGSTDPASERADKKKKKTKKKSIRERGSGIKQDDSEGIDGGTGSDFDVDDDDETEDDSEENADLEGGGGGGLGYVGDAASRSVFTAGAGLPPSTLHGPSACSTGMTPVRKATSGLPAAGGGGSSQGYALETGEELIWWYGTPLARPASAEERRRRLEQGAARGRVSSSAGATTGATAASVLPHRLSTGTNGGLGEGMRDATLDMAVLQFRRAMLFLEEHYDLEHGVWREGAISGSRRGSSAARSASPSPPPASSGTAAADAATERDDTTKASAAEEDLPSFTNGKRRAQPAASAGAAAAQEASKEMAHRLFLYNYTAALLRAALFFQDHLGGDHLLYAKPSDTVFIEDVLNMMMEIAIGTVKLKGFARALSLKLAGVHQHEVALSRLRNQLVSAGVPAGSGGAADPRGILYELNRAGAALTNKDTASSAAAGTSTRRGGPSVAGGTAVSSGTSEMMAVLVGNAAGLSARAAEGVVGVTASKLGCGLCHPVQYYIELTHVQYQQLMWERVKPLCRRAADFMDRLGKTGSSALEMLARHQRSGLDLGTEDIPDDTTMGRSASPLSRGFTEVSTFQQDLYHKEGGGESSSPRLINDSFGVGSVGNPSTLAPNGNQTAAAAAIGPSVLLPSSFSSPKGILSRPALGEQETVGTAGPSFTLSEDPAAAAVAEEAEEKDDGDEGESTRGGQRRRSPSLRGPSALSREPSALWSTMNGGAEGGLEHTAARPLSAEEASRRLLHCLTSAFQPLLSDGAHRGLDVGGSAFTSATAFFLRDTTLHAHVPLPPMTSSSTPKSQEEPNRASGGRSLDVTPILLASCDQMEQHVVLLLEKLQDRSETEAHVMAIPLYTDACQLIQDILASLEHVVSHYWTGIAQGIHSGLFDFAPAPDSMLGRMLQDEMALATAQQLHSASTSPLLLRTGDAATTTAGTISPASPGVTPSMATSRGAGAAATSSKRSNVAPALSFADAMPHRAESSAGRSAGASAVSPAGAIGAGGVSGAEDPRMPHLRFIPLLVEGHVDFAAMRHSKKALSGNGADGTMGGLHDNNSSSSSSDDEDEDEDAEPSTLREYSMLRIRHLIRSAGVTLRSVFMAFMNQSMVRVFLPMLQQFTQEDLLANDKDERIELCAAVLVEVFLGQWEQMLSLVSDAVLRIKIAVGETFSATIAVEDIHPDAVSTAMLDVSKVLSELESLRSACVKSYFRGVGMLMNAYVSLFPVMRRTGDVTLERRVRARLSREHLSSSATNKLLNALSILLDRTVPFLRRHVEVYNSEDLFSTSQAADPNGGGDRDRRRRRRPQAGEEAANGQQQDPSAAASGDVNHNNASPTSQMAQYHRLLVVEHMERHGKYVAQLCGDLFLMFVDMIHMKCQLVCSAEADLSESVRQREVVECMADLLCLSSTVAPLFVEHLLSPCLLALLLTLNPELPISDRPAALRRAESDFQEEHLSRADEHAQLVLNAILQMHLVLPQQRITRAVYRDGVVRPGVDWQRVSRHTASTVRPYLTDALVTIAESNEALHWIQQPALASAVTQKLLVHLSLTMMTGMTVNANYVELLSTQCSSDFFEHGALLLEAELCTVCQLLEKVKRASPAEHVLPELSTAEASLRRWYHVLCGHFSTMRRAHATASHLSGGGGGGATATLGLEEEERTARRDEMVQEALHHLEYMLEVIIASQWATMDDQEDPAIGGERKKKKKKKSENESAEGDGVSAGDEGKVVQPLPSAVTESIVQRLAARLEAPFASRDASKTADSQNQQKSSNAAQPHEKVEKTARKRRNSVVFRNSVAQSSSPAVAAEGEPIEARAGPAAALQRRGNKASGGSSVAFVSSGSAAATPKQQMATFVFPASEDATDAGKPALQKEEESEPDAVEEGNDQAVDDATLLYLQVVRKGKRLLQKDKKKVGGRGAAAESDSQANSQTTNHAHPNNNNIAGPSPTSAGSSQRTRGITRRLGGGQQSMAEGIEADVATTAGGGGGITGRRPLGRRGTLMGGSTMEPAGQAAAAAPGGTTSERRRHRFARTKAI